MKDIKNAEDVKLLVDSFYQKATKDPGIGHFFTKVVALNFEAHMPTMYAFWESVLFGKATYKGNPMIKHLALHQKSSMLPEHFERWLNLWETTINHLFVGEKANEAKAKAQQIAKLMQYKVGQMKDFNA